MRRLRSILSAWVLLLPALGACVTVYTDRASLEKRAEVASFQSDWPRAADLWYRVWLIDDKCGLRSSYETARALLEGGDPSGARAVATAGLVAHPEEASLYELCGRASLALGEQAEATHAFEQALEHEPERFVSLAALGSLRFDLGEFALAADVLARAHAVQPEDGEVARLLARTHGELGHALPALAAYESAFESLDPTSAELFHAARIGIGDPAQPVCASGYAETVTGWLERACVLDPQAVEAHLVLGRLYLSTGRKVDAAQLFERVVEIEPTHAAGLEALARALIATGDRERARKVAQHALATVGEDERAPFEELLAEDA